MQLGDVVAVLEGIAPLRYAESWDNVGLIVGDPAAEIAKVVVTVDYTQDVAEEAKSAGAQLIVAYHPPLFSAVKRVPHDALWVDAIRRDVALYSPHTALDVARDGTNDFLADACGIHATGRRPLRAFVPKGGRAEPEGVGLGRVGSVASISRKDLVTRIKEKLGLAYVLTSGPLDRDATCVAVSAGAGGEQIEEAIRAGAHVFVTGECRHHDALAAARKGLTIVATLHSNSERAAIRAYAARLGAALTGVTVIASQADCDPFTIT